MHPRLLTTQPTPPYVTAMMTVLDLIRLPMIRLDLVRFALIRLDLIGFRLIGAYLIRLDLIGFRLIGFRLIGFRLIGAHLIRLGLIGFRLIGAHLIRLGLIRLNLIRHRGGDRPAGGQQNSCCEKQTHRKALPNKSEKHTRHFVDAALTVLHHVGDGSRKRTPQNLFGKYVFDAISSVCPVLMYQISFGRGSIRPDGEFRNSVWFGLSFPISVAGKIRVGERATIKIRTIRGHVVKPNCL